LGSNKQKTKKKKRTRASQRKHLDIPADQRTDSSLYTCTQKCAIVRIVVAKESNEHAQIQTKYCGVHQPKSGENMMPP